ncbi:MAG TPA: DUF3048 domain-containing protein [Coriobacteriia bacterium]
MPFRPCQVRSVVVAPIGMLLLAGLLVTTGCEQKKPAVEAVWPLAIAERAVARPAGPIRWPLTGLEAPSEDAVKVRIVSVKIENSPAARPQSGLEKADVVYETVTEGGITRFNALYQSQTPATIGPVRSARASDIYLVPQYQALFAHCGGETALQVALRAKKYGDMDQFFNPAPYHRARDRAAPHNLYMDLAKLRSDAISRRGFAAAAQVRGLAFDRSERVATATVTAVTVPFAPDNKVSWAYDAATKTYLRSINGKVHGDKLSGRQFAARNVVVLWAQVKPREHRDAIGSPTIEIILNGSGRATVFRNGLRYDCTWQTKGDTPPVFKASDGTTVRLSPGVTWFQVIANDQDIIFK